MTEELVVERDGFRFFPESVLGAGIDGRVIAAEEIGFSGVRGLVRAAKVTGSLDARRAIAEVASMQQFSGARYLIQYVKAIQFGSSDGVLSDQVAIVMERAEESLHAYQGSAGPLTDHQVAAVLLGAARGLTDLHTAGFAHADLHPGNILRTVHGWKIADLSSAERLDSAGRSRHPSRAGTPWVFSPERRRDGHASAADDVWALGCLAIWMAAGVRPFQLETQRRLGPHDVARSVGLVGGRLRPLLDRTLAMSPEVRIDARGVVVWLQKHGWAETQPTRPVTEELTRVYLTAAVGRYRHGHLEVFVIDGGEVRHSWSLDDGAAWSGWDTMAFGDGDVLDLAVCSHWPGLLEVFVVKETGTAGHRWLVTNPETDEHPGWSYFDEWWLPDGNRATGVACASIAAGHVEVWVVDADGGLWSRYRQDEEWSDWYRLHPPTAVHGVAASSVRSPAEPLVRQQVVITGSGGERLGCTWVGGVGRGGWTPWSPVAGETPTPLGLAEVRADRGLVEWADGRRIELEGDWVGCTSAGDVVTLVGGAARVWRVDTPQPDPGW